MKISYSECNIDTHRQINSFLQKNPEGIVVIFGPTGSGKSSLSLSLHPQFPIEIISADSRQIFKYMNIGTDKIDENIQKTIPHHLIDIVEPNEKYTASQRKDATIRKIKDIQEKEKIPVIVGGTGLYIDTIYKNYSLPHIPPDYIRREKMEKIEKENPGILHQQLGLIDPNAAEKIHPNSIRYLIRALEIYEKTGKNKTTQATTTPPSYPILLILLERSIKKSLELISTRVEKMLENGLIDEVKNLKHLGYSLKDQAMNGIGYKETIDYLEKKIGKEELVSQIILHTNQYAKRQRTRLRKYIRDMQNHPIEKVTYIHYEISD